MRKHVWVFLALAALALQVVAAPANKAGKTIYRYKNDQGVTVMDSNIPPEYVNKGYEIVNLSGRVLKVVPPAPEGEAAQRALELRLQQEQRKRDDINLLRSYSNVADIDAAKQRNLDSLHGNINILKANLNSAQKRLQGYQSQAATVERSGRPLPDDLVKNINNLVQEQADIKAQIEQRKQEYNQASAKFDADRKRFVEITEGSK